MTKLDKYTVKFRLLYPWVAFPAQVGQRYNAIIKAGTTHFTASNFIGTGPFQLKQWSPGQSFVLTKNPNYFLSGSLISMPCTASASSTTRRGSMHC